MSAKLTTLTTRRHGERGMKTVLTSVVLVAASLASTAQATAPLQFQPIAAQTLAPPLPPLAQYPVQLVIDDDTAEGTVGVAAAAARQFLWFNRFTPGVPFDLEEIWVLFPPGTNMAVGNAIELAVYQDTDGNPANGATLLATFSETIQVLDGVTFSVYPLASVVSFDGVGDLLIGVVPRFIVSGQTSPTLPAALDTTSSQGRSWLGVWTTDPPNPPALLPPPDQQISTVDGFQPGNWMIRGFGTEPNTLEIPTLDTFGMTFLTLVLGTAAFVVLRRRKKTATLALLLALGALAGPASAVTIDTFTTNQAAINAPPTSNSSVTGGADIIGTRRGMVVENLLGAGPTSGSVAGGNFVLAVTNTTPDSRGEVRLSWDGDTNALVLSPTGLGNQNLTASNASGFRLNFVSTTALTEVEITVYDDGSNFSRAVRRVAIGGAQDVLIPFAEFRVAGGTGAVFSSVGAIEMTVRSGEGTATLNLVETTPATIAATKTDVQITDVDGDTRVDPGDRVRYTVTITNTGNQALNVDLSDTVDSNTTLVTGSTSSTPLAHNDQYGWFGNVTFSTDGTAAKPHLLANDQDADGDTLTVQAGTFPATTAQGGTLSLVSAASGAFTYNPPAGFAGVDSFNYTILDDNSNTSTATASIHLDGVVWFVDDSNTTPPHLGTQADPFQVLASLQGAGDPDLPGDIIFVYNDDGTPYAGGLVLEADQTLVGEEVGLILGGTTIVPAGGTPDITNAAGVGLTLATNNFAAGVTVTGTSGAGIFGSNFGTFTATSLDVTNAGGAALDLSTGTISGTYGTLSSAGTAGQKGINLVTIVGSLNVSTTTLTNPTTDGIFVSGSGTGTFSFGATTITDNNTAAAPVADGIDVATGNAGAVFNFSSLSVTADDGTGLLANASGTINISGTGNSIVSTGGPAVDIVSTSLGSGATFATLSSTSSTGEGVNLDTVTGTFTANGGSITGPAGIGFDLNAGSANVTYAGAISNTANALLIDVTARTGGTTTFSGNLSSITAGNGINVSSNTGGTINFSGATKTLNTGADTAVNLATNTGATINFTGGGLDIDTTSGAGFNATGGAAAITVQGGGNSITSTTGTALNVANTTIGASDLTFQSIASNGGTSGIVLNTTGSSGNLVVTGNGGAGTGGTIQSKATGISLTSTTAPSFSWMQLNNFTDFAIRGSSVVGFNLDNSVINGTNGDNGAANEGSIRFTELTGSATVTNCNISGGFEDNLAVINTSGTLNRLTVSGTTIGANSTTDGSDGILVEGQSTAVVNVTVQNGFFTSTRGDHFQLNLIDTAATDLVFTGNTITNSHPAVVSGGGGIRLTGGSTGGNVSATYNFSNNIMRDSNGTAIGVTKGAGTGTFTGTIDNNQVGVAATLNSGSAAGSGISVISAEGGTSTTTITNNQVRQYNNFGIIVQAGGLPTVGTGNVKATVTGNTISNPGNLIFAKNGFQLNSGTVPGDAFSVCLTFGGAGALRNSLVGSGTDGGTDFRLRQRQSTTVRLPGYAGANNDDAAVVTFAQGNNNLGGTPSGSATNTVPTGGGWLGSACPF